MMYIAILYHSADEEAWTLHVTIGPSRATEGEGEAFLQRTDRIHSAGHDQNTFCGLRNAWNKAFPRLPG